MRFILLTTVLAAHLRFLRAECPNACSSHGKCGQFDMCTCFRNWMANDCSERVCPFGLAHVDTPKGDIDASGGSLSGPDSPLTSVSNDLYPYGTTEQFPATTDSRANVLTNTAHYYMECSNKGVCDRATGMCDCLPGYEGSSCQRASCPMSAEGMCSGHGTCQTVKELASWDYGNIYELWDKDSTMACYCDPGYYGPDCSKRMCKHGFDPLYDDNKATHRYSNWTYAIYTLDSTAVVYGNYSITFYDVFGEDWKTDPIDIHATCATVISALEGLPNKVVPKNSVHCFSDNSTYSTTDSLGTIYDSTISIKARYWLTFSQNAGYLKQIKINKYLDGNRPTLYTSEGTASTLGSFVYANGFTGEEYDLVPDYCDGVLVTLEAASGTLMNDYLGNLDTQTTKLLKKCLGDADGNTAQSNMANEVYNWDHGSIYNPHLVKLVDSTAMPISNLCKSVADYTVAGNTGLCYIKKGAGFYATLYFDQVVNKFLLFNPIAATYPDAYFYLFTTTGHLQMVSDDVKAYTEIRGQTPAARINGYHSTVMYTTNSSTVYSANSGGLDCENAPTNSTTSKTYLFTCLNKDDYVMVFSPVNVNSTIAATYVNPKYLNLYKLKKISLEPKPIDSLSRGYDSGLSRHQLKFDVGTNALYSSTDNLATNVLGIISTSARVYKFFPPSTKGMQYAGECSGRGLCDDTSGTCKCFTGYTNDDCSVQNVLAK